jgi:predicted Zn-dependent peptidase
MSRIGASQLLHGEVLTVDEVLARIQAVTTEQVLEVAGQMAASPRTVSAVGPFDAEEIQAHLPALAAQ